MSGFFALTSFLAGLAFEVAVAIFSSDFSTALVFEAVVGFDAFAFGSTAALTSTSFAAVAFFGFVVFALLLSFSLGFSATLGFKALEDEVFAVVLLGVSDFGADLDASSLAFARLAFGDSDFGEFASPVIRFRLDVEEEEKAHVSF